MKKALTLGAVVVLVVGVSGVCWAVSVPLPFGEVKLKLNDASSHYLNGVPIPDNVPVSPNWVGAELRGIWRVTSVQVDGNPLPGGGIPPGTEITGVQHGLVVSAVYPFGTDRAMVHYAPMYRTVDEDNPGDAPTGTGGRGALFFDQQPDFALNPDTNGTPDDWVIIGNDGYGNPIYDYPGAGTLDASGNPKAVLPVAEMSFVPLLTANPNVTSDLMGNPIAPNEVLVAMLITPTGAGSSSSHVDTFFLNSMRTGSSTAPWPVALWSTESGGTILADWASVRVGGAAESGGDADMFSDLYWGNLRDTSFIPSGWQFQSEDPIRFYNIPEPGTLALLGVGLMGLVARRRRKS